MAVQPSISEERNRLKYDLHKVKIEFTLFYFLRIYNSAPGLAIRDL